MELLKQCPICGRENFEDFIICKDHTVSFEQFQITKCLSCEFKFTNPRPKSNRISSYYDSPDYISHSNSQKGIINNIYQKVRNYTIAKKIKLIEELLNKDSKKSILDIGCGTGEFLNACKQKGWKCIGVEPGDNARNFGVNVYGLEIMTEDDLSKMPDKSISIITMWHVLEHVHKLKERVAELRRILVDNGTLLVAVPNSNSKDATHYKAHWAAYDVPRHLYHFNQKNIGELFLNEGMEVKKTRPMYFDSYYVSLLSEKHKKPSVLNYLKGFWQGYKSNRWASRNNNDYSSLIYVIQKKK